MAPSGTCYRMRHDIVLPGTCLEGYRVQLSVKKGHDMGVPVTCEDEPGIWICLARVRKGKDMALPVTCEDEPGIWICLARVRKGKDMALPGTCEDGTGYGCAWHV
jgi:hypothetical protein